MPSVLVVDDLVSIHEMLEAVIQPNGFTTAFATDGEKGLQKYKQQKFDVVLADIDMKPMDGLTLLKQLRIYDPAAVVILITAYASTDSAIQALKNGAFDYIAKPFKVDELIKALRRGFEFRQAQLSAEAGPPTDSSETVGTAVSGSAAAAAPLVGSSPKIRRLLQQVSKVVTARAPVLLEGELGTGKRALAEHIHRASGRTGSFVVFNCAGRPDPEIEAEIFGPGGLGGPLTLAAREGTLFLQNVHSLSAAMQSKLSRLLQAADGGYRLVCTSTEDLEGMMDEGRFTEELFFRIAPLPLKVPALRERPEDIPALVREIAARSRNPALDVREVEFTEDALHLLASYRWPGNLLELEQTVSKAIATTEHPVITATQLPLRLNQLKDWPKLADYLAGQRRQYIQIVLRACRDDRRRAAEVLGVSADEL